MADHAAVLTAAANVLRDAAREIKNLIERGEDRRTRVRMTVLLGRLHGEARRLESTLLTDAYRDGQRRR